MSMEPQIIIARRIAQELRSRMLVNLGIGIPTLVANYVPPGVSVFFQSENGLIGTGPVPEHGMADPTLADAGGRPVTALPGASAFDSAMSFGLIRGGHIDMTVLGGLQVDEQGRLANWMIPGKMVPGMGGAMDLVTGAKRVIVAMQHTAKGKPKIVRKCTLPLTSVRVIDLLVTEMAVIGFPDGRATLLETAPGVSAEQVVAATDAELVSPAGFRKWSCETQAGGRMLLRGIGSLTWINGVVDRIAGEPDGRPRSKAVLEGRRAC